MVSIQAAADRAYLDVRYGSVWKHARLPVAFYDDADFIVGEPYEGSFVLEFVSQRGSDVVRRMREALRDPYRQAREGGFEAARAIDRQINARKGQVDNELMVPQPFEAFLENPDQLATRTFGDKSINKNIDQLLTPVRHDDNAYLKLVLQPSLREGSETYEFTKGTAQAFKKVIGKRELGNPVIYRGRLRTLDRGHNQTSNFRGKLTNLANDKDVAIYIQSEEDYNSLVPYMSQDEVTLVACPIIEFESFDPNGGDIQFVKILQDG